MEILNNISPQKISWVKSNKEAFEKSGNIIENLYYPENTEEFVSLINSFYTNNISFDLIGYSSNTLFLPTYSAKHVVCTKRLNHWTETNETIICECGVSVSCLSKQMVEKGIAGFEGLTDLPGTIASGVYGNCGCRGCSVVGLVREFKLLAENGSIITIHPNDLKATIRSTSLKRGEIKGTILEVTLNKTKGNKEELRAKAEHNHNYRKKYQPSAANNLGTTFNGGTVRTVRGYIYRILGMLISFVKMTTDQRKVYPLLLKLTGNDKFVPYIYYWNRYMFLDKESHLLFPSYFAFLKTLYKDVRLEIEIKD